MSRTLIDIECNIYKEMLFVLPLDSGWICNGDFSSWSQSQQSPPKHQYKVNQRSLQRREETCYTYPPEKDSVDLYNDLWTNYK